MPPAVSLRVSSHRFFRKNTRAQAALQVDDKDAGLSVGPQVLVFVLQGFYRLIQQVNNTLQTSAPTHDVHGRQSVLFVCV